jgi:hypothetical protein
MLLLKISAVLLLAGLPVCRAASSQFDPYVIKDGHVVRLGETPKYRTVTVIMCLFYAFLLASVQGETLFTHAHTFTCC